MSWPPPYLVQSSTPEKRYQYISRFLASDEVDVASVMASYGLQLCEKLTAYGEQLILMLDQSKVGNGFEMLMVSISMGARALPLLWLVKETKGAIGFLAALAITRKSIAFIAFRVFDIVDG